MDVDDGVAGVEIVQERIERGVAEKCLAVARKQRNAFEMQRVETVLGFRDSQADIVHWQQPETAEPLWVLRDQLGGVIVTAAREDRRFLLRHEADAGLAERQQRKRDAVIVHEIQRQCRCPVWIAPDRGPAAGLVNRVPVELRNEVEVDINQAGGHGVRSARTIKRRNSARSLRPCPVRHAPATLVGKGRPSTMPPTEPP